MGASASTTVSATAFLKSPYCASANSRSTSSGPTPRSTDITSIRFEMPGLSGAFVLGLVHGVEVAVGRDRREEPAQLGVLLQVPLAKERATLGVEARRQEDRGRVVHVGPELVGLIRHGDRVQVDDAVDRVGSGLSLHVLADRPDVVAEVL